MLNIVIPMAGAGSRFQREGYKLPKPLIEVHDVPMIQVVVENLMPKQNHCFIFICQREHIKKYKLEGKLNKLADNVKIIEIDGLTEGAACTVLAAKSLIDNDQQLMIANSDQFVNVNIDEYLRRMDSENLDGLIMTMTATDPKWSYVQLNEEKLVKNVVEKKVISSEATVGIYNFKKGRSFVKATELMIDKDERTNGEFYVAPAYNQLIKSKSKIGIYNVGSEGNGMYGLGIPEDLTNFMKNPISYKYKKI